MLYGGWPLGKFEVLEYLTTLRLTGDHTHRRYGDVHQELRRRGVSLSYGSVWRTMNGLYSDGLLEVAFDVDGLQRTAKFRARVAGKVLKSRTCVQIQKDYNTYRCKAESRHSTKKKETSKVIASG